MDFIVILDPSVDLPEGAFRVREWGDADAIPLESFDERFGHTIRLWTCNIAAFFRRRSLKMTGPPGASWPPAGARGSDRHRSGECEGAEHARSVEQLLPRLYLKGVSTGGCTEALAALLGPNARGCRPQPSPG